jgi:hypothetical protein
VPATAPEGGGASEDEGDEGEKDEADGKDAAGEREEPEDQVGAWVITSTDALLKAVRAASLTRSPSPRLPKKRARAVILAVLPHVAGEARGGLNRVDANFAIDARALIQSIEYNRG